MPCESAVVEALRLVGAELEAEHVLEQLKRSGMLPALCHGFDDSKRLRALITALTNYLAASEAHCRDRRPEP